MIRVIDGLRYNTETAQQVYDYSNGRMTSDFGYRSKTLYRTSKGAWFIHHVGGALTDMSVSVGNNGRGGSADIEPVCENDAYGFLEAHSDDSEAMAAIEKFYSDRIQEA